MCRLGSVLSGAASLSLAVGCEGTPDPPTGPVIGSVELTVVTTGPDADADGYQVLVDGQPAVQTPSSGTVTLQNLPTGTHVVTLTGVGPNCVPSPASLELTIPAFGGIAADIQVTCAALYTLAYNNRGPRGAGVTLTNAEGTVERTILEGVGDMLAWTADGNAFAVGLNGAIGFANADGSGFREIVHVGVEMIVPAATWRPDGSELLYEEFFASLSRTRTVFRVSQDGSLDRPLLPGTFPGSGITSCDPDWSPDGSKIAVELPGGVEAGAVNLGLFVVDVASETTTFLARGRWPAWSPDGSAIAYTAGRSACSANTFYRDRQGGIRIIRPDGSGDRPLTLPGDDRWDSYPSWSPDGSTLAFMRSDGSAYLIDADGSNERLLTPLPPAVGAYESAWSPDGSHLSFSSAETYLVRPDGTGLRHLVEAQGVPAMAWRPLPVLPPGPTVMAPRGPGSQPTASLTP